MKNLTHFDNEGNGIMTNVSDKVVTWLVAVARGEVRMQSETLLRIFDCKIEESDVLEVARLVEKSGTRSDHFQRTEEV
jgi:cyclic pyranopterin phosphate synthase